MSRFVYLIDMIKSRAITLNSQKAGVLYMEQNHLHGQQREFRIQNNTHKTKENDVKTILFTLAYLTPIKLPFCKSTGKREREREFFIKKKKKKKFKIRRKPFYSQVNDKKWGKKKQDKRSVLTTSMQRDARNGEYRSFILFFFLPFFIIYLTVKWFLTDFE